MCIITLTLSVLPAPKQAYDFAMQFNIRRVLLEDAEPIYFDIFLHDQSEEGSEIKRKGEEGVSAPLKVLIV